MTGHTSRNWLLLGLFGLSALLPLSLFTWTGWSSYQREMQDAEHTAVRTVTALHEHMVKVLETHEVVLNEIDRRIAGRSWDDIEADRKLRADLVAIEKGMDQILAISLSDAQGRIRVTTVDNTPPGFSAADREYFQAHRLRDAGLYISAPHTGKILGDKVISISRRRSAPGSEFDGVLQISVPVSYITAFWEQFAPTIAHVVPLVRADGQVIARYPALNNPETLNPKGPFLSRALKDPKGVYTAVSQVDGVERLNAYSRIKTYPLFISFSIETRAVLARWRANMTIYAIYTMLSVTALVGMTGMAMRLVMTERAAARRWQEQADRLAGEMAAREKAEAALRQSQKMEAIGQITGGLAHDFNNLLQAMTSGLYILSAKASEEVRPVADATMQAVERGAKLVRQLMAFSRRQSLEPQPVDVRTLVAGMGDLLQKAVGDTVRIEVEIQPGIPAVMVDPTQTELAILNLAINARDAMKGSGRITIAARTVEVLLTDERKLKPGRYIVLSVADTGCGMAPEVLNQAFDPFFTTKERGKGTGLGLSMVHGFASQSGGTAEIESRPGHGATVSLYLPETDAVPRPDRRRAIAAAAPEAGASVLLVDDEALARMGIAAALREIGYTVHEARDGEEALEQMAALGPLDLMITDYAMPGMSGTELIEAVRQSRPDLKVIMITGNAAFSFDETACGVSAILRKPFRVEELAERMRAVLVEAETPDSNVIDFGTASRTPCR